MKILVIGNDKAFNELSGESTGIEWLRADDIASFSTAETPDAIFYLATALNPEHLTDINIPVFLNSIHTTLSDINAAENIIRINGWPGFLKRKTWEVSGRPVAIHMDILNALQKEIIVTPDEPGFISARIISMIINEAFFARQDEISSEKEIDIAMRLGTNYPHGPFEWAYEIGLKNVHSLLHILSQQDVRYTPSSLLAQKANAL